MKKMLFLYIFHLFFFGSCKKFKPHEYEPLYPIDTIRKYEIVWKVPLQNDTIYADPRNPVVSQNMVVYSANRELIGFDKNSGKKIWTYPINEMLPCLQIWGKDKIVLTPGNNQIHILDINTGKLIYQVNSKSSTFSKFYVAGSNLFFDVSKGGFNTDSTMIMRLNINYLTKVDTIHRLRKGVDNYAPSACSFNTWINPEGDTILLFFNRRVNFSLPKEKSDVIAYNMTKKKEEYQIQDIDPLGSMNIKQIIIEQENGKAYFMGDSHSFCLDLLSKKMQWSQYCPQGVLVSDMILFDKYLFFGTNSGSMYSIYPESGQTRWFNKDVHGDTENMVVDSVKKIIYFPCNGDGRFYAVNADDGKILWREKGTARYQNCDFFGTGVAADHQNRRLYVTDRYFAICIKMID